MINGNILPSAGTDRIPEPQPAEVQAIHTLPLRFLLVFIIGITIRWYLDLGFFLTLGILFGCHYLRFFADNSWLWWCVGLSSFPPHSKDNSGIFLYFYSLYASKFLGYNLIRHVLHPKMTPHVTTVNAIRVISDTGNGGIDHDRRVSGTDNAVVVIPFPVNADNFAYLLICLRSGHCALVDAADADRAAALVTFLHYRLREYWANELSSASSQDNDPALMLTHVFTTHRHWDHAGGNYDLKRAADEGRLPTAKNSNAAKRTGLNGRDVCADVQFIGSSVDKPAATTHFVWDGDVVMFGAGHSVRCIATPGHTIGHMMFALHPSASPSSEFSATRLIDEQALSKAVSECPLLYKGGRLGEGPGLSVSMDLRRRGSFSQHAGWVAGFEMEQLKAQACGGDVSATASLNQSEKRARVAVFTGDCLFCGGCGCLFEAKGRLIDHVLTMQQQCRSCARSTTNTCQAATGATSSEVVMYVGHEYSMRLFSMMLDQSGVRKNREANEATTAAPASSDIDRDSALGTTTSWAAIVQGAVFQKRIREISSANALGVATIPSSLHTESCTNPLLTLDTAWLQSKKNKQHEHKSNNAADHHSKNMFGELEVYSCQHRRLFV